MSLASDAVSGTGLHRSTPSARLRIRPAYERTLEPDPRPVGIGRQSAGIGRGTGTTALRLAGNVQDYLATDISAGMIAIANEKHAASPIPVLAFRTATVEALTPDTAQFNAVLGFNYLHLVRDLSGTLRRIHALLAAEGFFISKTPCVGDMNPLIRFALPVMHAIGKATLCRRLSGVGPQPAYQCRRLRHSCR